MGTNRKSRAYAIAQTVGIVIFAAVYLLDPGPALAAPRAAAIAGAVLCVVGLLLMAAGLAALRSAIQIEPEPKAGAELVTSGIYRYLRHPMYTGILVIVIGLLLRQPALASAIAGTALIALLLLKTRFEESLLLARYPGYAQYRRRSWGVIPGVRGANP